MNRISPSVLRGTIKRYDPQSGRGIITCPTTRLDPVFTLLGETFRPGETVYYSLTRTGSRYTVSVLSRLPF